MPDAARRCHVSGFSRQLMAAPTPDCVFCQDALLSEPMSVTACGHVFHTSCLNEWFERAPRRECPLCKRRAPAGKPLSSFVRALSVQEPLDDATEEEVSARIANGEPPPPIEPEAERRALEDARRWGERQAEEEAQTSRLRATVHKLNAKLMTVRREVRGAAQSEARQRERLHYAAESADGVGDLGADMWEELSQAPTSAEDMETYRRETVQSQSRQLAWRCRELQQIEDKIDDTRDALREMRARYKTPSDRPAGRDVTNDQLPARTASNEADA